jgi:hypothetical protein
VLAAAVALSLVVGVPASSADGYLTSSGWAPAGPTIDSSNWNGNGSTGDLSQYVLGNRGFNRRGTTSGPFTWEGKGLFKLQEGTGTLPLLRTLTVLNTIALSATAFQLGWKIGSTLNTKWLHLAGVGLGTNSASTACTGGSSAMTGHYAYDATGIAGTSVAGVPGWQFDETDSACAGGFKQDYKHITSCTGAGGSCTQAELDAQHEQAWIETLAGSWVTDGGGCAPDGCFFYRYVTEAQMEGALSPDQPLQPWTSQPAGVSTGWRTAGGCGDTTNACSYPGSQANPAGLTGSGPVAIITDPGFPGIFARPGDPDGSRSASGLINDLNCQVDTSYACPNGNDPAIDSTPGAIGGASVDFPLPTCSTDVAACEAAINSAFDGAHVARPVFSVVTLTAQQAVLTKSAGAVVSTDPAGGAQVLHGSPPSTVTITANPDPLPVVVPAVQPWELPDPYCADLVAVGLTCTQVPLPSGDPSTDTSKGPGEVSSTDPPGGSRIAPDDPPVKVYVNPPDLPYPPTDPNNPAGPSALPSPSSSCSGYLTATADFSPLNGHDLASKFPFGIFTWIGAALGSWSGGTTAPAFDLPVPYPNAGNVHVDLAVLEPAMPVIRASIVIMGTLLMVWAAGSALIGLNGGGSEE